MSFIKIFSLFLSLQILGILKLEAWSQTQGTAPLFYAPEYRKAMLKKPGTFSSFKNFYQSTMSFFNQFLPANKTKSKSYVGKVKLPLQKPIVFGKHWANIGNLQNKIKKVQKIRYRMPKYKSNIKNLDKEDIDLLEYEQFLASYSPL